MSSPYFPDFLVTFFCLLCFLWQLPLAFFAISFFFLLCSYFPSFSIILPSFPPPSLYTHYFNTHTYTHTHSYMPYAWATLPPRSRQCGWKLAVQQTHPTTTGKEFAWLWAVFKIHPWVSVQPLENSMMQRACNLHIAAVTQKPHILKSFSPWPPWTKGFEWSWRTQGSLPKPALPLGTL